jgi:hypothetical protein
MADRLTPSLSPTKFSTSWAAPAQAGKSPAPTLFISDVKNSLIAVMLGRLKMSAEECKQAYLRLSERIFRPKRTGAGLIHRGKDLWQAKGRFDSKELEDAIKETIEDCKIASKEWFKEPDASCKV